MAFRLPRLQDDVAITDGKGKPALIFMRWLQTIVKKIETQEASQDATLAAIKLTQSFTVPVGVITARQDGTIKVATHTRTYGDGTSVEVIGGFITGLVNEQQYTVFYKDADQAGGAVTYQATKLAVAQVGTVHVVGQVTIPAVSAADVGGAGPTAPGYVAPDTGTYDPRTINYETP